MSIESTHVSEFSSQGRLLSATRPRNSNALSAISPKQAPVFKFQRPTVCRPISVFLLMVCTVPPASYGEPTHDWGSRLYKAASVCGLVIILLLAASSAIRSYRCDLPSTRTMTRNRHNAFMFLSHKSCIRCASVQEKERLNGYGDDPLPRDTASHFHQYPG